MHAVAGKAGFLGRLPPVWNALVTVYGACGDARRAFDEMADRHVVSRAGGWGWCGLRERCTVSMSTGRGS